LSFESILTIWINILAQLGFTYALPGFPLLVVKTIPQPQPRDLLNQAAIKNESLPQQDSNIAGELPLPQSAVLGWFEALESPPLPVARRLQLWNKYVLDGHGLDKFVGKARSWLITVSRGF